MVLATTVICALAMAHARIGPTRPYPLVGGRALSMLGVSKPAPKRGCACPFKFEPVCVSDGRTYVNGCAANCDGISV